MKKKSRKLEKKAGALVYCEVELTPSMLDVEALSFQHRIMDGIRLGAVQWTNKQTANDAAMWLAFDGLKYKYGLQEKFFSDKKWKALEKDGRTDGVC